MQHVQEFVEVHEMDQAERFTYYTTKTTPNFSFDRANPWIRIIDVHDGDSVKAVVEVFPGCFVKTSIRLNGIDTCEITNKNASIHELALAGRNRLIQLVTRSDACTIGKDSKKKDIVALLESNVFMVYCNFHGMDKYGRVLADLKSAPGDVSFNIILLNEVLALPYNGGTKCTETSQLERMTRQSA